MSVVAQKQGAQQVLIDQVGAVQAISLAEADASGILYAEGKIGHCGVPTANGRIYTKPVIERELKKMQLRVENASAIGAVDHPGDGKSRIVGQAGTILRKIWMNENGEVFGRFEIVEESSAGKDLAAFLRRGAQIGVSSRGMGSTRPGPNGNYIVGEDFKLTAYDFVADPAVSDAYPKVFTEDVDTEEVTVEQLRAQFPEVVQQIEEAACMKAQLTCEAVLSEEAEVRQKEAVEEAVEKARAELEGELSESIRATQYVQARADLNNEFAARLVEAVEALRPKIEEAVRQEMASNPEEMTARQQLEHVASILLPFAPTQDAALVISEKDAQIDELKKALDAREVTDASLEERVEKAERYTRMLAFKLHVEERVGGRPDADELKSKIGDVTTYQSADALKEAVQEVVSEADEEIRRRAAFIKEAQEKADAKARQLAEEKRQIIERANNDRSATKQTVAALMEQFNTRFAELEAKIDEKDRELEAERRRATSLTQKLQEQNTGAERQKSIAYAQKRCHGHPARVQIMEEVMHSPRVMAVEEINELVDSLTPRAQEPGGVAERVRAAMSQGRGNGGGFLGEDDASASFESIPDLAKFGLTAEDVRNYGGVRRR